MTYLVERLAELRKHLDHLREIRSRVTGPEVLERDLSLHNDVLFSLLTICQLVIDVAGELSSRRGERFEDYTGAVRNLRRDSRFDADLVRELERLPGFRNVVIHEYAAIDLDRVVEALEGLSRSSGSWRSYGVSKPAAREGKGCEARGRAHALSTRGASRAKDVSP